MPYTVFTTYDSGNAKDVLGTYNDRELAIHRVETLVNSGELTFEEIDIFDTISGEALDFSIRKVRLEV